MLTLFLGDVKGVHERVLFNTHLILDPFSSFAPPPSKNLLKKALYQAFYLLLYKPGGKMSKFFVINILTLLFYASLINFCKDSLEEENHTNKTEFRTQ